MLKTAIPAIIIIIITDESSKDGYTVYQEIGRKDYRKTEKTGADETSKVLD